MKNISQNLKMFRRRRKGKRNYAIPMKGIWENKWKNILSWMHQFVKWWFVKYFSWELQFIQKDLSLKTTLVKYTSLLLYVVLSLMVLRRVHLCLPNKQKWRKTWEVFSTSRPQRQRKLRESWKLCFNIPSRIWIKPRC